MNITIGMPIYRYPEPQTMCSLIATIDFLTKANIPWQVRTHVGESVVAAARNYIAHEFLRSDATHLFWTDADVVWEWRCFDRVLALGKQHAIVCAAYPTKTEPPRFQVVADALDLDADGLLTVRSAGLGFCCVQRRVFEELAMDAPMVRVANSEGQAIMVRRIFHGAGQDQGEDKNFYADAIVRGFEVKLAPDVPLGHVGSKMFHGTLREAMNDKRH